MQEAKKILLKYHGSYFQMHRDGELDKYKNYNVDSDTEKKWLYEHKIELIERLRLHKSADISFSQTCRSIFNIMKITKSDECAENLINIIKENLSKADSFIKLIIAEELQEIIEFFSANCSNSFKKISNYKSLVDDILQEIIYHQITISEDTKKNIAFEDTLENETIRRRAMQSFEKSSKKSNLK